MIAFLEPLIANLVVATLVWLLSVYRHNAGLVDIVWPLLFLMAAVIWFPVTGAGPVQWLVMVLVVAWALRLAIHLARRNLGAPEDRRYRAIRARNSPGFWWKSFFLVFVLQAVLAWVASWVLFGVLQPESPGLGALSVAGCLLAALGFIVETVADRQLDRFSRNPDNRGRVLDTGLWRYSRHPNYFGECCFWWGIFLVAASAGAWWTLVSPLLMTVLLLRVSGVVLLEKDIAERRPGYRRYIRETPAFIPGPPRNSPAGEEG
jgi:steroid 5-alpha reductase family enzyme